MRIDPTSNVTPEGSLVDLPTAGGNITEDRERKNQLPGGDYKEPPQKQHIWIFQIHM